MSSPVHKFYHQILDKGYCSLFGKYDGIDAGNQSRDFVHVYDCARVCAWILDNVTSSTVSGAYNVGTGVSRTFHDVAATLLKNLKVKKPEADIRYLPFPDHLKGSYQSYTCADLSKLRNLGYNEKFIDLESGINNFVHKLENFTK